MGYSGRPDTTRRSSGEAGLPTERDRDLVPVNVNPAESTALQRHSGSGRSLRFLLGWTRRGSPGIFG